MNSDKSSVAGGANEEVPALIASLHEIGQRLEELTAGEVMHSPILTIAAETDIGEAAGMMARVDVRHLAVVRGGALVGLLSDYHVARLLPDLVAQRHE